jgi:hypothetical protein
MYREKIMENKNNHIALFCIECGELMLDETQSRRYLTGKKVQYEGCVVNPKIINGKSYTRKRCYDCFEKEFGRTPHRFNVVGKDMIYLFGVSQEEINAHCKKRAPTKNNMIRIYGEEEGLRRWDKYCSNQAKSNTFEYKRDKYGWSKEKFDEYNKTRAVTLENCIKKHGEEKGTKVFNDYCEKQSYVGCKKEYFIEKYGESIGIKKYKELNRKKHLTRENFVRKYGEEVGLQKFNKYYDNPNHSSKIANSLFEEVYRRIENPERQHIYYEGLNHEYCVYNDDICRHYFLDFYWVERNKVIEFFGDYWHANPTKYDNDFILEQNKKIARDIWEEDRKRVDYLKHGLGISTLIIWEGDYNDDRQGVLNKCLEFLNA